jgi:hypothetical protein
MEPMRTPSLPKLTPAIALLAILFVSLTAPAQMKSYDFPADGFRASFPAKPEFSKETIPEGQLNFDLHNYIAIDKATDAVFVISVTDFGKYLDGKDPDEVLQGAENGALANAKAHVIGSHKKIFLGANHGLALEAETDEMHLSIRLYLVGGILYQLDIVSRKEKKYDAAATERFFDSFQLIARQ